MQTWIKKFSCRLSAIKA